MLKTPVRVGAALLTLSIFAFLLPAAASAQNAGEKRSFRGLYLGAMYGSLSNPTFRLSSGSGELPIPQSASMPALMLGYDFDLGGFGFGGRLLYLHAGFQTFAFSEQPDSPFPNFATYTDPEFTHLSLDLLVHWLPFPNLTLGVYGLLGLASSTEKYVISGSIFPQWNGSKSISEFDYSYGLGIRFSPVRMLSAFAEFRLIPGDLQTDYRGYLYSDAIYDYFRSARTYTKNNSLLLFLGLSVNF